MKLTDVQKLLDENGYTYKASTVLSSLDFYRSKGCRPKAETGPFWLLSIPNPNHGKNIEIIFTDASDDPAFYDLEFGGYWYELFDCREENLPQELLEDSQDFIRANVCDFCHRCKKQKLARRFCVL